MQKAAPIKIKKDKKKNTETGLLMGQNINIFSQLSASYLTNKQHTTQQEQTFIKQTQIIEYHDQNINRLISLLRKKAQVTKVKAVLQLKESILKMTENQIQQFISTYANLFQQIILNEQSKQVYQEFVEITGLILEKYKKIALKEISTLYPLMLITMKLNRVGKLLFTGTQKQINQKAFTLFLKKQIRKRFILISKLLLQNQQLHLVSQSYFQRNLQQYVKILKQLFNIYFVHSKRIELAKQTQTLVQDLCEFIFGRTIDQCFKVGGRAKASLLQYYQYLIYMRSQQNWDIPWKKLSKIVCQHFLQKDLLVQSVLWKFCNKQMIINLKKLAIQQNKQDQYHYFYQNLPKHEDKLLQCLTIGGLTMYKALPSYLSQIPNFVFTAKDTHKSIIQKITFIRKLFQQIINQQDQNETRIECYYSVAKLTLQVFKQMLSNVLPDVIEKTEGQTLNESKKQKEIKTMVEKIRMEILLNLQKKYYAEPPLSKNMISYFIPSYFCKLINQHQINGFKPTFNQKLSFQLYKEVQSDSDLLQFFFNKCQAKLSLLLTFFQTWPQVQKQVNLDMTENNQQYQITARIFLLSNKRKCSVEGFWFLQNWDLRKSAIIFDPRLTKNELQFQDSNRLNIEFTPISKNLSPAYQVQNLDRQRFRFFLSLLQNTQIQVKSLKFFLPYLLQNLLTQQNVKLILNKYLHKVKLLKQNKWAIGQQQIAFIRIAVKALNKYLLEDNRQSNKKNEQNTQESNKQQNILLTREQKKQHFKCYFASIGSFLKILHSYRMDYEVEQILKSLNQLLKIQQYQLQLFECFKMMVSDIFNTIGKSNTLTTSTFNIQGLSKEEKLKKNKIKRLNELVEKSLWHLTKRNSGKQSELILDLFKKQNIWNTATVNIQPWALGQTVLSLSNQNTMDKISQSLWKNFQQYILIISLLMSCQQLIPLQIYNNYKSMYKRLQSSLIKKFIEYSTDKKWNFIKYLIIHIYEKGLITQLKGINKLIQLCLKDFKNFKQQQVKYLSVEIVNFLIVKIMNQAETDNKLHIKSIICYNILNQIPLEDLTFVEETYIGLFQEVERELKRIESHLNRFLSLCLISNCFWKTKLGINLSVKWEENNLLNQLLDRIVPEIQSIQNVSVYQSLVLFSSINSLYSYFKLEAFKHKLPQIIKLFWFKYQKQQNELYYIQLQQKIKFVNRSFFELQQSIIGQVIQKIPQQALEEYNYYQKILIQLQYEQEQDLLNNTNNKSIKPLFIEYSQIIMKITSYVNLNYQQMLVNKKLIPNEIVLINLIQCPFEGMKRSCYILLKQLYDLKLVQQKIPTHFLQLLTLKLKKQDTLQDIKVVNSIYNFLYNWLVFMCRKNSSAESQNQGEAVEQTLQDFIQDNGLSQEFLNNVFIIIADKLDYLQEEVNYFLEVKQLLQDDFALNIEQETNMLQKIFTMTSKLLFVFSMNFPLFLRSFMDKSKKYRSVCEKLVRNYISDAIFQKQISMIEAKQMQWKADKNLQIYVFKNNKQIYAEYQHDVIRIGLKLLVRSNYPLMPIQIEFGEGLKLDQGSKWALMLQSQLNNKNNSIINGILLWKDNIDKKLSGVEQCAICYDIVNPSGKLPRKGCKTCKKKFHSNCIMKWFSKSNKSECPLCKSQFL